VSQRKRENPDPLNSGQKKKIGAPEELGRGRKKNAPVREHEHKSTKRAEGKETSRAREAETLRCIRKKTGEGCSIPKQQGSRE